MIKKLIYFILACSFIPMSGCWSSHEVNELSISAAMGLDKTDTGYLLTEQLINPKAVAAKNPTNASPITIYTAEGASIEVAINTLLLKSSRLIYNTHLRLVVIGEELAKEGIESIIDYLSRSYEFRTDFFIVIAKNNSANELLKILMPSESIPGVGLFNMLHNSSDESGMTKDTRLIELINSIASEGNNPVITGIEILEGKTNADNVDAFIQTDNFERLKFTGLGAFNKGKFAGWLNENESKGYNYITDNLKYTAEYAKLENAVISCNVLRPKSKLTVSMVEGKPSISINIKTKYGISEIVGQYDVSTTEKTDAVNKALEIQITNLCKEALLKAQKDLKIDIFGFGEAVHRKDKKYWASVKDKWGKLFPDIPVYISVKAELVNIGEISKSFFIKEQH